MLDVKPGALWIPGQGVTGSDERAAADAVVQYDSDLILGQNQETGDWIVFLRHGPHGGEPFPLLGLGRRLPSPDEIQKKLYQSDVRRHGTRLFHQIQRRNDEREKAAQKINEAKIEEVADAMVWGHRQMGTLPKKVFIPRGVRSVD